MKPKTILLVEDNADDEALTLRALQKIGVPHDIVVARDGVEAVDYFFGGGRFADRDPHETPQLTLLDLKLSRLSGLEVLQRVRADERTRAAPIVVMSTSSEERDILDSYRLGANSYIRKPMDFAHFVEVLRQLQQYWLALNEAPPKADGH